MSQSQTDPRTPGRVAGMASSLGRADLLRRLKRLSLGDEALPRVLRLLEEEITKSLEAQSESSFSIEEIQAVSEDAELIDKLRAQREERERVASIRAAGLSELALEDLQAVLTEARGRS